MLVGTSDGLQDGSPENVLIAFELPPDLVVREGSLDFPNDGTGFDGTVTFEYGVKGAVEGAVDQNTIVEAVLYWLSQEELAQFNQNPNSLNLSQIGDRANNPIVISTTPTDDDLHRVVFDTQPILNPGGTGLDAPTGNQKYLLAAIDASFDARIWSLNPHGSTSNVDQRKLRTGFYPISKVGLPFVELGPAS